jgi:hypothetical protein
VSAISNICTDCIWLEEGRIRAHGAPRAIVADYQAAAHGAEQAAAAAFATSANGVLRHSDIPDRWGSHEAEILDVAFLDEKGEPSTLFTTGDPLTIRIRYRAQRPIERPVFGVAINTVDGIHVAGPNTKADDLPIAAIDGQGHVDYVIRELPLLPGEYRVSASIYDDSCTHAYDYHDRRFAFRVLPSGPGSRYGVVQLPARWEHAAGASDDEATLRTAGIGRGGPA